jgi:selenocysteine lyase/cysteine desulfurase
LENSLKQSFYAALETYSNVHRGSGHNSVVTTRLFEQARKQVLEYLGLSSSKYTVIFSSPRQAALLLSKLKIGSFQAISSRQIGLPLGVIATAVKKSALPSGEPFQVGGGTTRLVGRDWEVCDGAPGKFEAGTPAIMNVIAFAGALQHLKQLGQAAVTSAKVINSSPTDILFQDEFESLSGQALLDSLRDTMIGRNVMVKTPHGEKPYINLDNAASTPAFKPVWETVCKVWDQPEENHREIISEARSIVSKWLNAPESEFEIIFTYNTTEAVNLLAESYYRHSGRKTETVILNTLLEHNSNDLPWRTLPNSSLIRLSIDEEGFIDLKELERHLANYNEWGKHPGQRIGLVAVSGASNVLGTCNDLAEISRIVHRFGAKLLVDAAQLVAHRPVDIQSTGIDYLVFSAHKTYAPFGTGVLIARKGLLNLDPPKMESIRQSGEENVTGIAALGKAALLLQRIGYDVIMREERMLTERAIIGMSQIPGLTLFGIRNPESTEFENRVGVIVFSLKKVFGNVIARKLADKGIGIRYGCHCAHMLVKHLVHVSPGLERFQRIMVTVLPNVRLPGLPRISIGLGNKEEEINQLIQELKRIAVR